MEQQRLKLNVGGESFVLNEPSDILKGDAGLLESIRNDDGIIPWWDRDSDGTIFLDRDPTFFQYILNYFHDASLPEECLSPANMKRIMREAEYYSLQGLSIIMSRRITNHSEGAFNVRGEVSKNLAIYLINLRQELRIMRTAIAPYLVLNKVPYTYVYIPEGLGYRFGDGNWRHEPHELETRTAIIEKVLHLVKCTLPKEKDPFHAFVQQSTSQAESDCLLRLDELIHYCTLFLHMKDFEEGSTADLVNKLVAGTHGWNTWQRHPPSNIMYKTPEFTLKRIKDEEEGEEAERRRKCGCYLCTFVPMIPYDVYEFSRNWQ